jgi:hypothetical protein
VGGSRYGRDATRGRNVGVLYTTHGEGLDSLDEGAPKRGDSTRGEKDNLGSGYGSYTKKRRY